MNFMEPLDLTQTALAKAFGVTPSASTTLPVASAPLRRIRQGVTGVWHRSSFRRRFGSRSGQIFWSAGVILFELIYGHRPFPELQDLLNLNTKANCPPISQFPKLDDVIR